MEVRIIIVLLGLAQYNWTLAVTMTASVSGSVSEDVTFIHETFPVPPSTRAIIGVDVSYSITSITYYWWQTYLLPVIGIYTAQDHINIKKQCLHESIGQVRNGYLHRKIFTDSRSLNCKIDITNIHCTGNITVQDFIPRIFSFSFGFRCYYLGSLRGLLYNMSMVGTNETECLNLDLTRDSICYDYAKYGVSPSESLNDFSKYLWFRSYECHQHSTSFLCNLYILHCDPESNEIIPPCREMCHDYIKACGHYALMVLRDINCDYLPSLDGVLPCFYRKVYCLHYPPRLTDGKYLINDTTQRNYSAEYSCNEGFLMEGRSTIFFMYNGEWSPQVPVCLANLDTNTTETITEPTTTSKAEPTTEPRSKTWVLVLTTLFILYILAMVVVIIAVLYKIKLKATQAHCLKEPVLLFRRKDTSLLQRNREFDAFVLYHFDSDDDFVVNNLLPELEETRGFNLCVHSRNFTPGRDIKDNIEEAIEGSNSAIIVMSQGFVDSIWCKEEFTHCYIENMKDAAFNLFVIMMQPADTLVNISPYMKTFFANKTYLQRDDHELFTKLATHLEVSGKQKNDDNENKDNIHNYEEQMKEFRLVWQQDFSLETEETVV